jgi:phospholipid transport system substrate-binding protein
MLRSFMIAVLGLLLTVTPLSAMATTAPQTVFVDRLGQQALSVLADKSLQREEALVKFKTILNSNFDVNTIGRFVLGRYWKVATPAEQTEYTKLFNAMVEKIYTDRFSLYSGETFVVGAARADAEKDTIVSSQIVRPQGPPVNVDWRVRESAPNTFKIVDVIVEGVSMSVTQRAEFASVIQRGGGTVESLLQVMRDKVATPATKVAG